MQQVQAGPMSEEILWQRSEGLESTKDTQREIWIPPPPPSVGFLVPMDNTETAGEQQTNPSPEKPALQ